jgi:hypothetical protein
VVTAVLESTEHVGIPVAPGHEAIIDARDFDLVSRHRWMLLRGHNGKIYAYASVTAGSVYMHRLIAGTPDGYETDHVNGDGLDNRRSNLRPATPSQNRANMWKPRRPDGSRHSSQYKGVSWDKARLKWMAKIARDGGHRNLGRYESEVDAARAYDAAAALARWGEFARLNFPAEVAS